MSMRGAKTKELWKNPAYRANMIAKRIGKSPSLEMRIKNSISNHEKHAYLFTDAVKQKSALGTKKRFANLSDADRVRIKTQLSEMRKKKILMHPTPVWVCEVCGISFKRPLSNILTHVFCSKVCSDVFKLLQDKKMVRASKYPYAFTDEYKEKIRQRDGFKCVRCGAPSLEFSRKFHVHHIDFDRNNTDSENLQTLCPRCHKKEHLTREVTFVSTH